WHSGVAGFSLLAATVLIANISALIWVAKNLDDTPFATIATNSCKSIENSLFRIHLGINVLSAGLLAGSNYCMQCLTSPTREEVDAAHAKHSYLNIGILSWRNVIWFRKRRAILLTSLLASSVPLHSLHLISPTNTPQIQFFYRLGALQDLVADNQIFNRSRWANISVTECKNYQDYESDRGSLLVVTDSNSTQPAVGRARRLETAKSDFNSSVLEYHSGGYDFQYYEREGWPFPASYCLSLKVPGRCRLQIHLWLLVAVVVLNFFKLACFLGTFSEQRGTPFMTVGDAIASFMRYPCALSNGMCLLSEGGVMKTLEERKHDEDSETVRHSRRFQRKHWRYYHSVSFTRWVVYATSCGLVILASAYYYNEIISRYRSFRMQYNFQALRELGLGKFNVDSSGTIVPPWCYLYTSPRQFKCQLEQSNTFHMIMGSIPQVITSTIYIAVNYLFTVMIHLRDWTRLALRKHPLRVSDPEPNSAQVSTYWLSLPYQYSIPLLISSIAIGWLVSQSLFYYRFTWYDDNGLFVNLWDASTDNPAVLPGREYGLGYSALGVICSIISGVMVLGVSLAVGLTKCTPGLPLGPTNSFVIAAACHPPENDRHAARNLVRWGAVSTGHDAEQDATGHCTITSRRVEVPIEGRWYA
ncbi:hypothetical protein CC86DRAFT_308942, partial [Ophiobolus disseminans]